MNARSINQVADLLNVTPNEVMDASGLTLGELEHHAELDGYDPSQYRQIAVLTDSDLQVITDRLNSLADLYCAVCGTYVVSVNPPAPPVPVHCTKCRNVHH
ncbi:hypothetical protein [Rhodococcus sp. USK13]|uniref:hypothetical protein n=1 Tax=Rhodococcus sp. USK13 TaxID=2806442 RepID=UPI001BCCDBB6|nr:hypothetical protein [Rhodococcus sp. USK13]